MSGVNHALAPSDDLPTVGNFDPKTTKILLVQGGSLPGIMPDVDEILIRQCNNPFDSLDPNDTLGVWLEHIPTDLVEGRFPRSHSFRVSQEIVVGTVDELVKDYRDKLVTAVRTWLMLDDPDVQDTPSGERGKLCNQQPLFDRVVAATGGKVAHLSVLKEGESSDQHPKVKAYTARQEAMILAAKEKST